MPGGVPRSKKSVAVTLGNTRKRLPTLGANGSEPFSDNLMQSAMVCRYAGSNKGYPVIESHNPLSLDTPYGIGEIKFSLIVDTLASRNIQFIVEFGSGLSTARLAIQYPYANIVSIEQEKEFLIQTNKILIKYDVKNVDTFLCDLKRYKVGPRSYLTYDLSTAILPKEIDFVLIDGPVEAITLRGREAILYMIFSRLKVGSIIALDDYHRKSARNVVCNWLNSYRGNLKVFKESDDLLLLEKIGQQDIPCLPGMRSLYDNWAVNIQLGLMSVKRFLAFLVRH